MSKIQAVYRGHRHLGKLKEDKNKLLIEVQKNTNIQLNEIIKTIQDLKPEFNK